MPLASDAFTEQGGAYSRDSFLAGGINISYNKDVGIGKSRDEFLEQGFCPRIAVGLKHHDFPSAPGLSYRSKSRPDLRRMVAVIIQNGNASYFPLDLQAAMDATVLTHSFLNGWETHIQFPGDGNRCEGVVNIEQTGTDDGRLTHQFILVEDGKKGTPSGVHDFVRPVVR